MKQRRNNGVSTVIGSMLFMIIVVTLASILFVTLYRYNEVAQASIKIEEQRTQEKIVLLSLTTDSQSENLKAVLVSNNGSITTRIRAVYINSEFRGDPSNHSINPSDTYINAKNSLWIQLPGGIKHEPASTISLASERGIKTVEYQVNLVNKSQNQPSPEIQRSNFGPLQLDYNKFYYAQSDPDGNRLSDWKPGWNVTEGSARSIMWNITVTNVDDRSILLNQYSCFTLVPNALGSASQTPWYIEPTGGSNTMTIAPNQTVSVVYIWGVPRTLTNARPQTTPNQPFCKVILTFYGSFLEHDGSTKPYGQTIPFEAVIIYGAKGGENYFTTTILDPISTPLLALQTDVSFSGYVNATANIPNNAKVTLQYSTTGVSPWTDTTSVLTSGSLGTFSGTFTAPSPGTYYFRAYFEGTTKGNDTWAPSVSTLQTIIVNQRSSSTSLSLSASTINLGQSITATANVAPSLATGSMTFEVSTDNGTTFSQLGTTKSLLSGSAVSDTYTPSAPGNGWRFRAVYGGDINVAGSTSSVVSLTVNKATPTIPAPTLNPDSQINLGGSVTASVNITGVLGVIPTGTVTFQFSTDGGSTWTTLGATKTLVSGSATSDPYTPPTVSNQYRFRALYSGDSNYNSVSSTSASLTVKTDPTISAPTLSPASPIPYGTSVTANVTVSGSAGTPTGYVDFYVSTDGGATFTKFGATKSLVSGSATSDPYTPPSTGSNYQFRAVYLGDISYNSVQSSATPLTVNQGPSTTSLTLSPSSVPLGSQVTATATVAPASATGTVMFEVSTDNGVTFSQFGSIKSLSSGSATSDAYTPSTLGSNYRFRAIYSGDSNLFGSTSSSVALTVYGPLDHFVFSTIGDQTAGTAFSITITAKDLYGNTVANYAGSNSLAVSTGTITPTNTGAFVNGVRTISVTLSSAGSGIFVTTSGGGASGQSNSFTVNPGALSSFRFGTISSPQTAGIPFSITITAQDSYGNTVTSYVGQNSLTSAGNISPITTGSFTSGTWTGTVTLTVAGTNMTIGTTGGTPTRSGVSNTFTVVAAGLDHFTFNTIGNQIEGVPFNITLTAKDAYENTVTTYAGTNTLADLFSNINPSSTGAFSNGVWTGSVTIASRHATDTITTAGGGKSGTSNSFVITGPLDHFSFNTIGNQVAGTAFSITITAVDSSGSTITGYNGTNTLSASTGTINPTTTGVFSNGVRTISVTLTTASLSTTISTSGASKSGISNSFAVAPAALDHFSMSGYPSSTTAGQVFNGVTVTAYDVYNNIKTNYVGQVYFTSTDAQATLPYITTSKYTFTSGDQGSHTFNGFSLKTAGSRTITVRDDSASKLLTSNSITVNPASLHHFTFNTINSPQTVNSGFTITITAQDQYGNTVTGYSSSTTLTASTGAETINPNSASFLNGQWIGTVALNKAAAGVTLSAVNGGISGTSNAFNVYGSLLFSSTISPTSFHSGTNQQYTITISNLCTGGTTLGSATIAIPAGFSVSSATITPPGGRSWSTPVIGSGLISVTSNPGSGNPIQPGESITIAFTPTQTPTTGISYTWTTTAYTVRDYGGTTFNAPNPQPQTIIQYYLTVNSARGITSGQGWYNAGTNAYAGLDSGTVAGGSGIQYAFTSWGADASGTGYAQSDAIVMNGPKTASASWHTEYLVTFAVSPDGTGTTTPSTDTWYDEGATLAISASPNSGYTFSSWNSDTAFITIADPASNSTTATINGAGTVTATFDVEVQSTSLTISCNPTTVNQNGSSFTTVSGSLISLSGVPNKTVNLHYQAGASGPDVPPSGGTWVLIASVTTAADGTFTYQWNPDDTLANGYYWIKAEFAGDTNYAASEATTGTGGVINLQLYAT